MSKGFSSGFLVGALFGGAISGAIGAVVVSRSGKDRSRKPKLTSRDHRSKSLADSTDPEVKRRELEAKIARLNDTIDDVREQLHVVNTRVPANDSPESAELAFNDVKN